MRFHLNKNLVTLRLITSMLDVKNVENPFLTLEER